MARKSSLDKDGWKLFIRGFNIDDDQIRYHLRARSIERIAKGVYIRCGLDHEERADILRRHACRIVSVLHPRAILCGSAAYHHAPVGDVMTIQSDARSKSIGAVNFVICRADGPIGAKPDLVTIRDDLGDFKMWVQSKEMLILHELSEFRGRLPIQSRLTPSDLEDVFRKALIENGTPETLLKRLGIVARSMPRYTSSFARAKEFLEKMLAYEEKKTYLKEFNVFWNRQRVGTLGLDGASWLFDYDPNCRLSLTLCDRVRKREVPPFIGSILPERRGEEKTRVGAGYQEFDVAERYMSNIVVRPKGRDGGKMIIDTLEGALQDFTSGGALFAGEIGPDLRAAFELRDEGVSRLDCDPRSARISGMQQKFAANLSVDGVLSSSIDKSFTHIVKPPLFLDERSSMASMEWFCMALASLAGVQTERFAIADMNWHAPVFIAERFDIRTDLNDTSFILAEEFLSIFGRHNTNDKTVGDMLDVAKVVMTCSTNKEADAAQLLKQTVYSWIIGNCDMHLKNLLMLKRANASLTGFESVQLSPAYDLLCTSPYQQARSPVLTIGASRDYDLASFRKLAKQLNMDKVTADEMIASVLSKAALGLNKLLDVIPQVVRNHRQSMLHIHEAANLVMDRCTALKHDLDRNNLKGTQKASETATFR